MPNLISMNAPITLGNNVGLGSDGILHGFMTPTAVLKCIQKSHAQAVLCFTEDGGAYTDETTPANEDTADDVEIIGTTIATGDGIYVGHASKTTGRIDFNITTQGNYTTTTFTHEYFNGTAYVTLTTIVDGTTAFEAAAGIVSLTFDIPVDWAKTMVDNVLGYWVKIECDSTGGTTTPCQIGQIWWIGEDADATYTDYTTEANSAGASDVPVFPVHAQVGDYLAIVQGEKFCKLESTIGTAGVHTLTITYKYWKSDLTWATLTVFDDTTEYTVGTSTYLQHFAPPTDWIANTAGNGVDGEAGFTILAEISAFTSLTTVPLLTQVWAYPMVTGAEGLTCPITGTVSGVGMQAFTNSASNADSQFLLVNVTSGSYISWSWTMADYSDYVGSLSLAVTAGDELALVQFAEDGSTEFADAQFSLSIT